MSSIIASSEPSPGARTPSTGRGVLSSSVSPSDCASRRAGSMVSTTVRRPRSAARSARAAATVVLPTPPEPQQTTTRSAGSSSSASTSRRGPAPRGARVPRGLTRAPRRARARRRRPGRSGRPAAGAARPPAGRAPDLLAQRRLAPHAQGVLAGLQQQAGGAGGRVAPADAERHQVRGQRRRCPSRRRRTRARCSSSSSGGRTWLSTSRPSGSPSARSSATASEVSCTGMSSSRVTRCTAVAEERRTFMTDSACAWIGPTLASPAPTALTLRKLPIRPVGGASRTTWSYRYGVSPRRLPCRVRTAS